MWKQKFFQSTSSLSLMPLWQGTVYKLTPAWRNMHIFFHVTQYLYIWFISLFWAKYGQTQPKSSMVKCRLVFFVYLFVLFCHKIKDRCLNFFGAWEPALHKTHCFVFNQVRKADNKCKRRPFFFSVSSSILMVMRSQKAPLSFLTFWTLFNFTAEA